MNLSASASGGPLNTVGSNRHLLVYVMGWAAVEQATAGEVFLQGLRWDCCKSAADASGFDCAEWWEDDPP